MPGWIALRYLNDPATAREHFAHIDDGSTNPIVLARANYWRGRAAEAVGDNDAMRAGYQAAARHNTAYYGQLARAKLGLEGIELRAPLPADPAGGAALSDEIVRAADMLYAIGERDLVVSFAVDLAENCGDAATLAALGELAFRRNDARAMLETRKDGARPWPRGRSIRLPHHRDPAAQPDRTRNRTQRHLFGGTHRKRVRPARQVVGQRGRPDAGHAGSRARHRQEIRRRLRLGPDGLRSRLQYANRRGRTQRAVEGIQAAPTS